MNRAKEILGTTSDSLHRIADACGFESLDTAFRKATGITPSHYRR